MSTYIGDKSLDAEVSINLVEGKIIMDYSLNQFFNPCDNYSYSTKKKLPIIKKIEILLKDIWSVYYSLIYCFVFYAHIFVLTILRKDSQYWYQKHQKNLNLIVTGMKIIEKSGASSESITYQLDKNLWFEYELFGEYREKIKSISLKRHIITVVWQGISRKKQEGWIVEFKFISAPQDGKLILRYV